MIIQLSSTISDSTNQNCNKCTDSELKEKFNELFENNKDAKCQVNWVEDGMVEIQGAAPMALHNFTLQAEALGRQIKYHKKTIIEIV